MKRPPLSPKDLAAYYRPKPARRRTRAPRSGRKDLIPLDTGKIRGKALAAHAKAERELARLTDQLKRYHERDVPGFRAWCSRTFGALLTQLRELGLAFQEKQALANEIADLVFRDKLSEAAAYREVMWRRANPEAAAEKDRLREEADRRREEAAEKKRRASGKADTDRDADPWDDLDRLFDDDDADDDAFDADGDFAEFIENLFGCRGRRARTPKATGSENKTARELYRAIARRLHPDHHGHMSEVRKHLWNEAQKAHRAGDVETLRTLLAQCESGEAGLGAHTPVSVLLHLIRRLKAAMRPVRGQIRQVNRKPEWNFAVKIEDPRFVRNVEAMIREDIRHTRRGLDDLTRALDALAREATRPARKKERASRSHPVFPGF